MSTIIGVFDDKESAESALREIEDLGFTKKKYLWLPEMRGRRFLSGSESG